MPEILSEWVVLCKDEEFYLTEKQFETLMQFQEERFVRFDTFVVQPAMVAWSKRRPAQEIKNKYPCKNCFSSGLMPSREPCPECKGTGIDLTK